MTDFRLWIVFFALVSVLLIAVLYALQYSCISFARHFCFCERRGCCCWFKIDWEAYQRERASLERLRELRREQRDTQLRHGLETFSQIPGAIPDSYSVGIPQPRPPQAQYSVQDNLTTEQRKRILERVLVFQPFGGSAATTLDMEAGSVEETKEVTEENGDEEQQQQQQDSSSVASSSAASAAAEHCCAICLDDFQEGEMINESEDCPHFFHKECLVAWLMKHDLCPCCRRVMITEGLWKQGMEADRDRR